MPRYVETAKRIAKEAHAGQPYGDRDYYEAHLVVVAGIIRRMGYGEDYESVGWLHDSIEDQGLTREKLLEQQIPLRVVSAVDLLTKRPGVPHQTYLDAIAKDAYAIVGKFADSSANYANTILFLEDQAPEKFESRVATYAANIAFLQPLLPSSDN